MIVVDLIGVGGVLCYVDEEWVVVIVVGGLLFL